MNLFIGNPRLGPKRDRNLAGRPASTLKPLKTRDKTSHDRGGL
jgi:hypothetical protein